MDIASILIIVNICISALGPVLHMFDRVKKSECLGSKIEFESQNKKG